MPADRMVSNIGIGNPFAMSTFENQINLGTWELTENWLDKYLLSVGDTSSEYIESKMVPAIAISALVIGALLETLKLPKGTIHSLQDIETIIPVSIGESVSGNAELSQTRQRGELKFITVRYLVNNAEGEAVQVGRSTVLVPQEAVIE